MGHVIKGHLLCLVPFPAPEREMEELQAAYPELKVTWEVTENPSPDMPFDESRWHDVTYLVTLWTFPKVEALAPKLKLVHVISAGLDIVVKSPLWTSFPDLILTNSVGVQAATIAEWSTMTYLTKSRMYDYLQENYLKANWASRAPLASVEDNLGKRVGILGYGSLGRQHARIAKALGMDVVAFTASPRETAESRRDRNFVLPGIGDPNGEFPSAWYHGKDKAALHQFLDQDLDWLVVTLPLSKSTKGILAKEEFEILSKRNAFVTNVGRGELIIQEDLIKALESFASSDSSEKSSYRRPGLRGAALDVTTPEPLPSNDPLWKAPNLHISPHLSFMHRNAVARVMQVMVENLKRLSEGKELLNKVSRSDTALM